jgi:hypothetical protein
MKPAKDEIQLTKAQIENLVKNDDGTFTLKVPQANLQSRKEEIEKLIINGLSRPKICQTIETTQAKFDTFLMKQYKTKSIVEMRRKLLFDVLGGEIIISDKK